MTWIRALLTVALVAGCWPFGAMAAQPTPTSDVLATGPGCAPRQAVNASFEQPAPDFLIPAQQNKGSDPYCDQMACPFAHPYWACWCACDVAECYCWNACAEDDFFCYSRCWDEGNACRGSCGFN